MGKRGDISLWFLIESIGAVLTVVLLTNTAISLNKGTYFERLHVAKDLCMQLNTMISIPGDAYMINYNMDKYLIRISDNKIEVAENDFDGVKGTCYFIPLENQNMDIVLRNPKHVVIFKKDNQIKVLNRMPEQNEISK